MPRILVDKQELKKIRDSIDELLKDKNQNVPSQPSRAIYNYSDLTEKEKLIINYLKNKPGHTKEQVVKNLGKYSRVPILNTVKNLAKEGLIIIRHDEANSRIHHLYINNQHVLISLIEDLILFKQVYFDLIEDTRDKLEALYHKDSEKAEELRQALIMPYKYLIVLNITSDLFLWRERPLDEETLHRKFAIFFSKMQEIHTKLYEIASGGPFLSDSEMLNYFLYDNKHGFSPIDIYVTLKTFEEHGLSESAEAVIDTLWKINYPILPHLNWEYNIDKEDGRLKDWRLVISGYKHFEYIPKTEQLVKIE